MVMVVTDLDDFDAVCKKNMENLMTNICRGLQKTGMIQRIAESNVEFLLVINIYEFFLHKNMNRSF
jgi:hypothetical protein